MPLNKANLYWLGFESLRCHCELTPERGPASLTGSNFSCGRLRVHRTSEAHNQNGTE